MRLKHWFYTAPLRLRSLFRRRQVEHELDEELQYHIDRQIEENIAKGMTPMEARYAAMRAMGGVERRKEECRDTRRVRWIEDLAQDVRYSLRIMRKNPGFTAVAVIALALGIGANTAIFSVVNAALLRPLPYEESERLVVLYETNPQQGRDEMNVSYPNFADWRAQSQSFEQLAACLTGGMVLTGKDEPAGVQVAGVSADFFSMLRVKPLRGRAFLPEEDKVGGAPVVLVSHALWQR